MTAVPNTISLIPINTNAPLLSSDHRTNYAAIQAAVNGLIACLEGGAAAQVLEALDASDVAWAYAPGTELGFSQITAPVNVTSTTEATGTPIISPGALNFDGGPVMVEFFCPYVSLPAALSVNNFVVIALFEGANEITRLALPNFTQGASFAQPTAGEVIGRFRFVPTAGSHTYAVTAVVNSTTGTPQVGAGPGGTAGNPPAFIRFTKV